MMLSLLERLNGSGHGYGFQHANRSNHKHRHNHEIWREEVAGMMKGGLRFPQIGSVGVSVGRGTKGGADAHVHNVHPVIIVSH